MVTRRSLDGHAKVNIKYLPVLLVDRLVAMVGLVVHEVMAKVWDSQGMKSTHPAHSY